MSYENDPKNQPTKEGERVKNFFKRVWNYIKAAKMELIILACFFVVDLVSKDLVARFDPNNVTVIPYILSFNYTANPNAAFGSTWFTDLFNGNKIVPRVLFCVFAVAASAVFMLILVKNKGGNKVFRAGLAMLIAGALGNMIDRMFLGYVRDFIDLDLFTLITGGWWQYTFNIADVALVVGVILVIVYFLFLYDTEGRKARKAARLAAKAAAAGEHSDGEVAESGATTENAENAENVEETVNAENSENSDAAGDATGRESNGGDPQTIAVEKSETIDAAESGSVASDGNGDAKVKTENAVKKPDYADVWDDADPDNTEGGA